MSDLFKYAESILEENYGIKDIESVTKTLNFLQALIGNPRLWRGRDKNAVIKPIFSQEESVLKPLVDSSKVLDKLVNYVLLEASVQDSHDVMESRISLLFNCIGRNMDKWRHVIELTNEAQFSKMARKFLTLTYMRLSNVVSVDLIQLDDFITTIDNCALDEVCHTTVTAFITAITTGSQANRKVVTAQNCSGAANSMTNNVNSLELIIRKMVVTYPVLFLRQLPAIAFNLRGKACLEFAALKAGGYLTLFKRILNILEHLRPFIYEKVYRAHLGNILCSYFALIQKHDTNKEVAAISARVSEFLNGWLKHVGLQWSLFDYLADEHKIARSKITELISELPEEPEPFLVNKIIFEIKSTPQSATASSDSSGTVDGYLDSKKYLDYEHYCKSLLSTNNDVRSWAYVQILKYLRRHPSDATKSKALLFSIFDCFEPNRNYDVVNAMLDNLPEFIIYVQEYAWPILKALFQMGINSNTKVNDVILKIIEEFNLEYGC